MSPVNNCYFCGKPVRLKYHARDHSYRITHTNQTDAYSCAVKEPLIINRKNISSARAAYNGAAAMREIIFTREFIHAHGLEFDLASEWEKERR